MDPDLVVTEPRPTRIDLRPLLLVPLAVCLAYLWLLCLHHIIEGQYKFPILTFRYLLGSNLADWWDAYHYCGPWGTMTPIGMVGALATPTILRCSTRR